MTTTDQALEGFIQDRVDAMYAAYGRANQAFADAIAEIETIRINLDRAMEGRNHERIGENAMARLIARLRGEEPQIADDPIARVVWRESTGPAPTAG